jgi:hypothetical protein
MHALRFVWAPPFGPVSLRVDHFARKLSERLGGSPLTSPILATKAGATVIQKHMNFTPPTLLIRIVSIQDGYLMSGRFVGSRRHSVREDRAPENGRRNEEGRT